MLKLDEDTRAIPLLTCLRDYELPAAAIERHDGGQILELAAAASMN